ncbi:MAG: hypothetical protein ACRDL6_08330 [Solirubrobacterales bacterium]
MMALIVALTGTAVAGIPKGDPLKLGMFQDSSRDRLAGTGVIQYAAANFNTGTLSATTPKTYTVTCAAAKKATAGGFKWTGATAPLPSDYRILDAYPNGSGFVLRLYILGPTAENQALSVYANCVKSRRQDGAPPA